MSKKNTSLNFYTHQRNVISKAIEALQKDVTSTVVTLPFVLKEILQTYNLEKLNFEKLAEKYKCFLEKNITEKPKRTSIEKNENWQKKLYDFADEKSLRYKDLILILILNMLEKKFKIKMEIDFEEKSTSKKREKKDNDKRFKKNK